MAYPAVALTATGGAAPYTWSIGSGALPGGLTLAPDGSVSGTPSSAGTFTFTIRLSDAGDGSASLPGTITIVPALSVGLISSCAQYCNVELGCDSACGTFGQQSGGLGPYSYTLTQGPLPAGTSLSGLSLAGSFKGASGWLQFTAQVGDTYGAAASISPKFWMYDHVSLAGGSCYRVFTDCMLSLPISGGVAGGNPSVALVATAPAPNQGCWSGPTPLPAGYTLTVSGGAVKLFIPRSQNTGGYGAVWTLAVTDHTDCAANTYCTTQATATIGIECT